MPKFLYHVTYLANLDKIATSGLLPNANNGIGGPALKSYKAGKVFLTDAGGVDFWLNRAEMFAYNDSDNIAEDGLVPVVLRVVEPKYLTKDEEGTNDSGHEAYYCSRVNSEIEVWTGNQWQSIYSANLDPHTFVDEEGYIQESPLTKPKFAGAGDANIFLPRHHTETPALHSDPVFETEQEAWDTLLPDHKVAHDYEAMFKQLIADQPQFESIVKREVQWAKTHLKKQDRISWYLRWWRLSVYDALSKDTGVIRDNPAMAEKVQEGGSTGVGVH